MVGGWGYGLRWNEQETFWLPLSAAVAGRHLLQLYYPCLGGKGVVSNNYIAAILSNEMRFLTARGRFYWVHLNFMEMSIY